MNASGGTTSEALFQKYIQGRKILIADGLAAGRSVLFNLFKDLGAKLDQLILANTYHDAEAAILKEKPQIVVTEYDIGKRCGLDLFQSMREKYPEETKKALFIIVTGNTSQTAVARSLEEEIDGYIIKPYTIDLVRNSLLKLAYEKVRPPQYKLKLEEGKKAIADGKLDDAEKIFNEAAQLDAAPALAHYYIGQIKYLRSVLNQAEDSYKKGLNFNRIHYKCMVGLYDLFAKMKRNEEAYEVVRRIAKYFPANPKRLAEVIRLAIATGRYEDIERYYKIFIDLDERDEQLNRYTCAALVVCGKYYLSTKAARMRGIELFQKAATISSRPQMLCEIIVSLLDFKLVKEAQYFLNRFPPATTNSNEYHLMRFLMLAAGSTGSMVIDEGRALLGKGVVDERLYKAMIERSAGAGLKPAVDDLLGKAKKAFPEKAADFDAAAERGRTAAK